MTSKSSGFTLIELLVVVALIGIISAIGIVSYNGYVNSAKKKSSAKYHATDSTWSNRVLLWRTNIL